MKFRLLIATAIAALLGTLLYAPAASATGITGATLIGDINQVSKGSDIRYLTNFNEAVYFSSNDGSGTELWKSNGSTAMKVVDLSDSDNGSVPYALTVFQEKLYFFVLLEDGTWLYSLDKSDKATALLKVGPNDTFFYYDALKLNASVNSIFFTKVGDLQGTELYKWSPQLGGIETVAQVTLPADERNTSPYNINVFNDHVLYMAYDGTNGILLYVYNGSGIVSYPSTEIVSSTTFNGKLYFNGWDPQHRSEIWTYDGTTLEMVVDYFAGTESTNPLDFTVMGGNLYFTGATNGYEDRKLMKLNGTDVTVVSGAPSDPAEATSVTAVGNKLYVTYRVNDTGVNEFWTSDGATLVHQTELPDFYPTFQMLQDTGSRFTVLNDELYYPAAPNYYLDELVRVNPQTDTVAATLTDNKATESSYSTSLTSFKNKMYFVSSDGIHGREIWEYDGVNAPTIFMDINPGISNGISYDPALYVFNDTLYFGGDDGIHGVEIWTYDGINTPQMLSDQTAGPDSTYPRGFVTFNGELFYVDNQGSLSKISGDGTGSTVEFDSANMLGNSGVDRLTVFNNSLYFVTNFVMDSTFRWQILYRYDGTNPATPVGDPLIGLTNVTHLFATPDFLYFSGSTSEFGDELYRLDGTNTTPTRLMDFAEGSNSSYPIVKGYFNNLVYFTSNVNQGALFTVNVAGEIVEFALDPIQGRYAQSMFQIGDKLYWMGPIGTGNPYTSKWALWSKTGDQPVVQEADSYTMLGMDYFPEAWEIDGKVYFISDDGEHGRELFRLGDTSMVERLNKTKIITAFKANKPVLSWNVKKSIRTFVHANPTATVAKCVGRTAVGKWSWAEKKLARDRATAVCNYAASVQSGLSKWISSGPGKQAGKAFSRVSLTLRN